MTLLLLVLTVILSIVAIIVTLKFPKTKLYVQIIFLVIIVFLGYLLIESIMKPIRFDKELQKREAATIQKLKNIRTMQEAYKDVHGKYTGSFDTLINFVKTDSFELVQFAELQEWDQDMVTKEEALEQGILEKSTTKKSVLDSLFGRDYNVNSIRYIPFTGKKEFFLGADQIETSSKVIMHVFEAHAKYEDLLADMDRQLVINYVDERSNITDFEGLKVGSLVEATNNEGNWEK